MSLTYLEIFILLSGLSEHIFIRVNGGFDDELKDCFEEWNQFTCAVTDNVNTHTCI